MIVVEDLYKSFDGLKVLQGISFQVAKGETLALIGASGSGKSVLLKHIARLIKPDGGRILIDQKDIRFLQGKPLEQMRSRFGFLFQGGALFDSLTVFENVAFPLEEKSKESDQEIRERVISMLDQVGLIGAEDKYPAQISGGMVKRVALARSLVMNPEIMLFDEPTSGLDPVTAHNILNLIHSCHNRFGFTGVIVTHAITRVFQIVQKVAMLHKGKILIMGTPEEIVASDDPNVQQFISLGNECLIHYR
ncbi:MAG: ABC transporter ATP-binding protein [Deltaproteobacteria bacterium RBG_13_47_9]|nr:MAG: ABC transporter ATP-binding protein [Deltaproteobacteria bacterium RBG_13_47_9]